MTSPKTPTTRAKAPAKPAVKPRTRKPKTELAVVEPERLPFPGLFASMLMPEDLNTLPLPENPYFLIGGRRNYVHKRLNFGRVIVPFEDQLPGIPDLDKDGKYKALVWQEGPKVPADMIGQAWSFFRAIWNKNKSEAMLDLYYNNEKKEYRFFVPPQMAHGGGVKCIRNPEHIQTGWRHVGTLHSHCNFGAGHSGTDQHDADGHDGTHFTIGHVDKNPCQIAVMLAANTIKWDSELADVMEGDLSLVPHPVWWERYVEHPAAIEYYKKETKAWTNNNYEPGQGWRGHGSSYSPPPVHKPGLYGTHTSLTELLDLMLENDKFDEETGFQALNIAAEAIEDLAALQGYLRQIGVKMDAEFKYTPLSTSIPVAPFRAKDKKGKKKAKQNGASTKDLLPTRTEVKTSCNHSEPSCAACYQAGSYVKSTIYYYSDGSNATISETPDGKIVTANAPDGEKTWDGDSLPFGGF